MGDLHTQGEETWEDYTPFGGPALLEGAKCAILQNLG